MKKLNLILQEVIRLMMKEENSLVQFDTLNQI